MRTLFTTKFGSHLYGTETENSDQDFKSIIIPDLDFIISEKRWTDSKSTGDSVNKNTKDDIDTETYSLHGFLQKAYAGDTGIIDMLHATDKSTIFSTPEWEFLKENRTKFYTKNMSSYVGYCRSQAAKYCLKGSRLDDINKVLKHLSKVSDPEGTRLKEILDTCLQLSGDYVKFVEGYYKKGKWVDKPSMVVCESKYEYTMHISHIIESLEKKVSGYGSRSELAKQNNGVDFKALHHALRASYQVESILVHGDFEYPLRETDFLVQVKLGQVPFEDIKVYLEDSMDKIKALSEKSKLPDTVDNKIFEDFKRSVYREYLVCYT